MQIAASLILTNCFLSSRALNRRCSMTIRPKTSLWSKACSCWRSASRKNTWGEEQQWSQQEATHIFNEDWGCPRTMIHTHTQNPQPDRLSQVCQVWSSNYIDSDLKAWSPLSWLIHTVGQIWDIVFITSFFSEGGCFQVIWDYPQQDPIPNVYDTIYSLCKSTV